MFYANIRGKVRKRYLLSIFSLFNKNCRESASQAGFGVGQNFWFVINYNVMIGWVFLLNLSQVFLFMNIDQNASLNGISQVAIDDLFGLKILIAIRDNYRQTQ